MEWIQWASEPDFDKQTFTYDSVTYTYVVDEVDWKQTMVAWTPDNKFYVVTKDPINNTPVFTPVDTFSWASILWGASEVEMWLYNDLMKQYEINSANYKEALAQYNVDMWRYNELDAAYQIDHQEYLEKYKTYVDSLPTINRAVAWNIINMNYQILTSEWAARDEQIKKLREYKSRLLIDRIIK